jgi:hypothetical protein
MQSNYVTAIGSVAIAEFEYVMHIHHVAPIVAHVAVTISNL